MQSFRLERRFGAKRERIQKTQTVTEGKCAGLILEPCNPRSERAATSARITRGHLLGQEGMVRALGSARCRRDRG